MIFIIRNFLIIIIIFSCFVADYPRPGLYAYCWSVVVAILVVRSQCGGGMFLTGSVLFGPRPKPSACYSTITVVQLHCGDVISAVYWCSPIVHFCSRFL